jgi:hypothetical protein
MFRPNVQTWMSNHSQQCSAIVGIPGLKAVGGDLGDPKICIAVLDGPVDTSHSSLAAADLTRIETLVSGVADRGPASQHGTHVASVIFAHHDGPIKGIAPRCQGLIIPVFRMGIGVLLLLVHKSILHEPLINLFRQALMLSTSAVVSLRLPVLLTRYSLMQSGTASNVVFLSLLRRATGCDCLHIPGALPSVLR